MGRITINPSRFIAVTLIAVHTAAAGIVLPLQVPAAAKAFFAVLIAASLARTLWRHAFLWARAAIVAIVLEGRESASVQTRDGTWRAADVLGTSYVSPLLTVLNLRVKGSRLARHVVIVPDSADSDDFRRLRVVLLWGYRRKR